MSHVLVRVWDLFNVNLVLHSLELWKLKSRREIHEGVRNIKIKKKNQKLTYFAEVWLQYCEVMCGMTSLLCLVCVA